MALYGVANSGLSKMMFPVSIGFGEEGDIYLVIAEAIAGILQSMLSCWHLEVVDVLK